MYGQERLIKEMGSVGLLRVSIRRMEGWVDAWMDG